MRRSNGGQWGGGMLDKEMQATRRCRLLLVVLLRRCRWQWIDLAGVEMVLSVSLSRSTLESRLQRSCSGGSWGGQKRMTI